MKKETLIFLVMTITCLISCKKNNIEEQDPFDYQPPTLPACQLTTSTTSYKNNVVNRITTEFDNQNRKILTVTNEFDTLGRTLNLIRTKYTYNGNNIQPDLEILIRKGSLNEIEGMSYDYFDDGRLKEKKYYTMFTSDTIFEKKNNWTYQKSDVYEYHSNRRLAKSIDRFGKITEYDTKGNVIVFIDPCCYTYKAEYVNNLISASSSISKCCGGGETKTSYKYDGTKLIEKATTVTNNNLAIQNGTTIETYTYDAQGRVLSVRYTREGEVTQNESYTYGTGKAYEKTTFLKSKLHFKSKYDVNGAVLLEESYDNSGKVWLSRTYQYDNRGNLIKYIDESNFTVETVNDYKCR